MFTSSEECRTISELLAGHALNTLTSEEANMVSAHLATCAACRDEHDCLTAVSAHLALLRDALACDAARRQTTYVPGQAACRHASRQQPRRRSSAHAALDTQLTLSQWVTSLTCVR